MEKVIEKIDEILKNWHDENPSERPFLYVLTEKDYPSIYYNAMGEREDVKEAFIDILMANYDLYQLFKEVIEEVAIERSKLN